MFKEIRNTIIAFAAVFAMILFVSISHAADTIVETGTGLPGIYTGAQGKLMAGVLLLRIVIAI